MTFSSSFLYAIRLCFPHRTSSDRSLGRRSLFGAMMCIGISLVPLVSVLIISEGMIQGITGRMIGLSTQDLQVYVSSLSPDVEEYEDMVEISDRFSELQGITGSYPEMQGMALVSFNGIRTGATVRGVQNDIFQTNTGFSSLMQVKEGEADLSGERNMIVGEKISQILDIHPQDKISLITVEKVGEQMVPKMAVFTVSGVVSSGYQELDALWVFIPLETAFSVLSKRSSKTVFSLTTSDPFSGDLAKIKQNVRNDIMGYGDNITLDQSRVYSWNELNAAEYENFASTKLLLLLIMLLIVLVASVNISSALVMIVMERRKEIAILKSVGADSSGITASFLLIGIVSGAGGVLTGIPVGLLAGVNINRIISFMEKVVNLFLKFAYVLANGNQGGFTSVHLLDPAYYLQEIPVIIPFGELLVITLGTLILSLIVSAIPAIKAGKEKPLDTLRKM
ncbi:MAG: ABC transporter permease [Treponema sp.]|nr:ABC transporter permease [Treponema sp.]